MYASETKTDVTKVLLSLKNALEGDFLTDKLSKAIYATDASVYRMLPLAVAHPKHVTDLKNLVTFAAKHKLSLIPRAAGTSLAGQCVGNGIVVDISRSFANIISINETEKTVVVQPGVVRDALNNRLKPFKLFFGPNTSTSNRCMIGGMVGNNSSGTTSIQYGVTRDKVLKMTVILSDASEVEFGEITSEEFQQKLELKTLEGEIYNRIYNELKDDSVRKRIKEEFPKPEIHRRNTGYAIDKLIDSEIFSGPSKTFNMCQLLSGSEGTLAFTTQITLKLDILPPEKSMMVATHYRSIQDCLNDVEGVMQHNLHTCEMMDKVILDCTKQNKTQEANRQFIQGDPQAILMCEVKGHTLEDLKLQSDKLLKTIADSGLSYANAILIGNDIDKAVQLRKAGLGLLGNMIGDKKSAACIEDTAVSIPDLANYIADFTKIMTFYNQDAIYYAHAGAGELHLRPILNLKKREDVVLFRKITTDVAHLVKSYGGSMSGEHGDGIVRAEFIPLMIGTENYEIVKRIKTIFDPQNIFNPGKIVDAFPMDENLRYEADRVEPEIKTLLDFSSTQGILRAAEKCNGSGDCRKMPEFGGAMCPSYRATKNEKDTTRSRANALREFLTHSDKANRFDHEELKDVFSLCLSCKACASECPSSVDIASLKAEFSYQYQKVNGFKFKASFFAKSTQYNKLAAISPMVSNVFFRNKLTSTLIKNTIGIHEKRSLPLISKPFSSFKFKSVSTKNHIKTVYLFVDEFTNYLESDIAIDAKVLLESLNYKTLSISDLESGRSFISKGFLDQAKDLANKNIASLKTRVSKDVQLVGIEPSAILTFRDEYLKLADDLEGAKHVARHTFLIEEFLQQEIKLGNISSEQFTKTVKTIKFHGHCHQKSLGNQLSSFEVLNLPKNYKVTIIPSGCCGMAGSFGYEKETYEVSMAVGEQTLFPAVRRANSQVIISANGTSCRHQIKDGTSRKALHPVTILRQALL